MPHSTSASIEEHNASISLSFSSASRPELIIPQWPASPPDGPKTPEYPESRRKRIRTAPPSPPMSCSDFEDLSVDPSKVQIPENYQTPTKASLASLDRDASEGIAYLPTPPESQVGEDTADPLGLPYPTQPRALSRRQRSPLPSLPSRGRGRESAFGSPRTGTPQSASTSSPDRYINHRGPYRDPAGSFRLGKPPHLLSDAEKLLRQDSATPDPFVSGSPRRTRRGRSLLLSNLVRSASRSESRSVSNPDVLTLSHPAFPSPQLRQASVGAVWNIGGGSSYPTGPIQGILDGRGGLIGSRTNAPLYTAKFLDKDDSADDRDTFEDRLAAALEIDRTRRILDFSRPPPREPKVDGTKRRKTNLGSRTQWKYGEWMREGDISCKQAYQTLPGSC